MADAPPPEGGDDEDGAAVGTPPDPWAARSFLVGYRAHNGDMMVFGGIMMIFVGILATVVRTSPGFLVASVVGALSAFYFRPTLDLKTPQLGASRNGLYIARVGIIPWEEVAEIRVVHRALRTLRLATLVVRTGRPLGEAVSQPDRLTLLQRITARNARVVSGAEVHVPLHTLAMSAREIEERLRALYDAAVA